MRRFSSARAAPPVPTPTLRTRLHVTLRSLVRLACTRQAPGTTICQETRKRFELRLIYTYTSNFFLIWPATMHFSAENPETTHATYPPTSLFEGNYLCSREWHDFT